MKRTVLIGLLFFLSSTLTFGGSDLKELRAQYFTALKDASLAPTVYEQFLMQENPSAKMLAYQSALEAIMTKTTWNLFKRINYLNKSEKTMDKAVSMEPNNVEVRFMRLAVEHQIPYYLGYSKHLDEDKAFIIKHISEFNPLNLDPIISAEILRFVQESGRFSKPEALLFKLHLALN